ncbi:hypothetical protein [Mobilicoccus caccae]|uniref:Ribbon-helix-helix protein, copG family n=1 Tax=Mobilicoccus caccae TaxID=1859295 RepID=A0ABQ6IQL1_9MICO|nr:hypothetical protein [Mobilicoccus caccae]GMA40208.1 hypothetical protein GCM10025883_22530 [Mobilicoccus caccae]
MKITVEFTTDEFETITAAARREGTTVEEFTRSAVLDAVTRAGAADVLDRVLEATVDDPDDEVLRLAVEHARDRLR